MVWAADVACVYSGPQAHCRWADTLHSMLVLLLLPISQEIFGAGPTGKVLLLPQEPNAVHIMVATGTGNPLAQCVMHHI